MLHARIWCCRGEHSVGLVGFGYFSSQTKLIEPNHIETKSNQTKLETEPNIIFTNINYFNIILLYYLKNKKYI